MEVSAIIPTYQRPEKLAACVRGLARQSIEIARYEVIVALDGPDGASASAAREAWGDRPGLVVLECPRAGYNAARNAALASARGRLLLSLNDDVLPEAGLIEAHERAHAEAGRDVVVTGYSPFVPRGDATLFDELCAHTSMIFFYDTMIDAATGRLSDPDPARDWGFRHCWGLNFSARTEGVRAVGGFTAFDRQYGYDDIEMGWKLARRFGCPVLFRPGARADHDHRYRPREVLAREFRLGVSAWLFAGREPEFARDVFGRDIRGADEVAYSRAFVERERSAAERQVSDFLDLGTQPASAVRGPGRLGLLRAMARQQALVRRWVWRRGLLHAAEGAPAWDPPGE